MQSLSHDQVNYMTYLKVSELLDLQGLLSTHHDEMLFIVIHQVFELWFKQIMHELEELIRCFEADNIQRGIKVINRITTIQKVLITQIDVLETMTPTEFSEFRDNLRPASGFQSVQFREIEFLCGLKNENILNMFSGMPLLKARLEKWVGVPTIYDHFIRVLARRGFTIPDGVLNRNVQEPYQTNEAVLAAIEVIYKQPEAHYDLYTLCEALLNFDENFNLWRYRHVKMVERTIGMKTGTGGSAGAKYLMGTITSRFFPELWDVRALIGTY